VLSTRFGTGSSSVKEEEKKKSRAERCVNLRKFSNVVLGFSYAPK
jgi:hypothetical protein